MKVRRCVLALLILMLFASAVPTFAKAESELIIQNDTVLAVSGKMQQVLIPEGVTSIADYAFYGHNEITFISLPSTLQTIGAYAFSGCESITAVTIPYGVRFIGESAFYHCSSLRNVIVPGTIQFLGDEAFAFSGLAEAIIQEGVMSLGNRAFASCPSLSSVALPDTLSFIGPDAFSACSALSVYTQSNEYAAEYCRDLGIPVYRNGALLFTPAAQDGQITYHPEWISPFKLPIVQIDQSVTFISKSGKTYPATNMLDGMNDTSWQFRISDLTTYSDAYITVTLDEPSAVHAILLKNGYLKINSGLDQYYRNGRLKQVEVSFIYEGENTFTDAVIIDIPDTRSADYYQQFALDWKMNVTHIRIKVLDVYKGSRFDDDVAVSEIGISGAPMREVPFDGGTSADEQDEPIGEAAETYSGSQSLQTISEPNDSDLYLVPANNTDATSHYQIENLLDDHLDIRVKNSSHEIIYQTVCPAGKISAFSFEQEAGLEYYIGVHTESGSATGRYHITWCDSRHHILSEFDTIRQPTCAAEGMQGRTCALCGQSVSTVPIPAPEHVPGAVSAIRHATCTEDGLQGQHCTQCGTLLHSQVIPATGHTEGEAHVTKQPTCTEEGISTKACAVCSLVLAEDAIPAWGHDAGEPVDNPPAACAEDGLREQYCSLCGELLFSEVLPAHGHSEGVPQTEIAPTCTLPGINRQRCIHCNIILHAKTIPPTGHVNGDPIIELSPTCTESGVQRQYCELCKQVTAETLLPATGHTEGKATPMILPSCTAHGLDHVYCVTCGCLIQEKDIPALGHNYTGWVETTEPTMRQEGTEECSCLHCGDVKTRAVPKLTLWEAIFGRK